MRTGIALGSNLGDRLDNLRRARDEIERLSTSPVVTSPIYESDAVDCEADAPAFLNAVLEIDYPGSALQLLRELRAIEARLGRPPDHARNSSRTIDLDVLYFGGEENASGELQLPHPRIAGRRFVLAPLADIRPDLVLPQQRLTTAELLGSLPTSPRVVRANDQW